MPTVIKPKYSVTTTALPVVGDLVEGEIAINAVDGRLFVRDNASNVVEVGLQPAGSVVFSSADINGGTIDGTEIGATTPDAGAFTTLGATGTVTGPSGTWAATGMDLATGDDYKINGTSVLNSTTLGSAVINSSLTSLGKILTFESTGIDDNAVATAITLNASNKLLVGTTDTPDARMGTLLQEGLGIQSDTDYQAIAALTGASALSYVPPGVEFYRSRGTVASPTAVQSGDFVSQLWGGG